MQQLHSTIFCSLESAACHRLQVKHSPQLSATWFFSLSRGVGVFAQWSGRPLTGGLKSSERQASLGSVAVAAKNGSTR
jgi:hypothetical protein